MFPTPQKQKSVQYCLKKIGFRETKRELTLGAVNNKPVYTSAPNCEGSLQISRTLTFLPSSSSSVMLTWWTAHSSLGSSTWTVSVPPVLFEGCTFDPVELGEERHVPDIQLLLG